MNKTVDISGKRFGYLTAVKIDKKVPRKNGGNTMYWLCKCDCGKYVSVDYGNLTRKNRSTKSCGCKTKEMISSSRISDITGMRFGKLVAIRIDHIEERKNGRKHTMWLCKCDCGNETITSVSHLKSGVTSSCGCIRMSKNGLSRTRLSAIYNGMISRCYDEKDTAFKNYGGRGIYLCDEWRNSFMSFYNWSVNNGYDDFLTIERINNDKGYSPENCKWATRIEQANNKRNNVMIDNGKETHTISQWSRITGINKATLDYRHRKGYSPDKILSPCSFSNNKIRISFEED